LFESKTGVAALSIASNLTLTLAKLAIGLTIGSVSVIAEAIHSGVDLMASLIAYFAVRTSAKAPDVGHPYGHGKFENASGTIEGVLILLAAGLIIFEAVNKLSTGVQLPEVDLGLYVMVVSVVANTLVSRQLFRVARRTDSLALEADAYHLTTDIATSAGVLGGLIVVKLTGLAILDPLVALGVAGLIIRAAWDITRRSALDLVDRSLPQNERETVMRILSDHGGEHVSYHNLRSRKSGAHRYIDLHLVVESTLTVSKAHDLCDDLERHIESALPNSTVMIHIEPTERARKHATS
jgi:cation diffusion facilitator family transporter